MTIKSIDKTGAFVGEYVNNAAGFECRGTPGYELQGRQTDNRVRFTVRRQGKTLRTTWSLAYVDQSGRIRILNGQDTFQQTN